MINLIEMHDAMEQDFQEREWVLHRLYTSMDGVENVLALGTDAFLCWTVGNYSFAISEEGGLFCYTLEDMHIRIHKMMKNPTPYELVNWSIKVVMNDLAESIMDIANSFMYNSDLDIEKLMDNNRG